MNYLCACSGVGGKFRFINTHREACAQEQKHVHYFLAHSHAGEACANVRTHMHIFRGMHTRLGTCELLVRMIRSWEKFRFINTGIEACAHAPLLCTLIRRGSMRKCSHAYAHTARYVHLPRNM